MGMPKQKRSAIASEAKLAKAERKALDQNI
jgi:hypothetical protein